MAWVAEPFFASLGGSAFVVVRTPDGKVEVVDGNNAMPITAPTAPGQGAERVYFPDYADGMFTQIGGGSVAVPGALAAIGRAWEIGGHIEWEALFAPAIEAASQGFPMPRTSAYYLSVTWDTVWSKYPEARALFSEGGVPIREGHHLVQGQLADTLRVVATQGAQAFFGGEVGRSVIDSIQTDGGFMSIDDLIGYKPAVREPVSTTAFGWRIATNPPPAIGGAVLTHMLALLEGHSPSLESLPGDTPERIRAIADAQRTALNVRKERYQDPSQVGGALADVLASLRGSIPRDPSTTHTSCTDSDGHACSLTESNGYGSGLVAAGILLNNTLGEEELNPMGLHGLVPGGRCHSNMAPSIASGDDLLVALGSPGADRIVTALAQVFLRLAVDGMSLTDAIAAPRAHLTAREEGEVLCYEPGLPGENVGLKPRAYDDIHMFFGGVNAASVASDGTVDAAHDPRRSGAHQIV